jgi:hypothetical protein
MRSALPFIGSMRALSYAHLLDRGLDLLELKTLGEAKRRVLRAGDGPGLVRLSDLDYG